MHFNLAQVIHGFKRAKTTFFFSSLFYHSRYTWLYMSHQWVVELEFEFGMKKFIINMHIFDISIHLQT